MRKLELSSSDNTIIVAIYKRASPPPSVVQVKMIRKVKLLSAANRLLGRVGIYALCYMLSHQNFALKTMQAMEISKDN